MHQVRQLQWSFHILPRHLRLCILVRTCSRKFASSRARLGADWLIWEKFGTGGVSRMDLVFSVTPGGMGTKEVFLEISHVGYRMPNLVQHLFLSFSLGNVVCLGKMGHNVFYSKSFWKCIVTLFLYVLSSCSGIMGWPGNMVLCWQLVEPVTVFLCGVFVQKWEPDTSMRMGQQGFFFFQVCNGFMRTGAAL